MSTIRSSSRLDPSRRWSWRLLDPDARPRWHAYAFAVLFTLAALAARLAANFQIGDQPIVVLFVVPIVLSAIIGGIGPGLVATATAAITVPYFLMAPHYSFAMAKLTNAVGWIVMISIGALISVLIEALHRSRRRLEAAERLSGVTLASIADGVVTTDVDGRVAFLNAEAERLTGWTSAEAAGQPLSAVLHVVRAGTREPLADPVAQILGAAAPIKLEHDVALIARDGRELAVDDSGAPIRAPDGTLRGVVVVFRDCSERREAEEALRASEERLRVAQETVGVGVYDYDLDSGRLTWSRSLADIYGLPPGAVIDRYDDWPRLVHPDDVERVEREWRRAVAAREPFDLEFRIVKPSGEERWLATKGTSLRRDDGTPYRVLGVTVDISERKRSEDELRHAHDVLALAQRASASGVWDVDFVTGRTYCSPEDCDLYGLPWDRHVDFDARFERVHGDDRAKLRDARRKLFEAGAEWSVEFRVAHPSRGERWLAGRGTLSRDAQGRPLRFSGVDMDITDRRRAQEALLESELRFRSYVENAPIALLAAARDARIIDSNPAAVELLGYDATTLRGMFVWDLIAPEDRDRAARGFDQAVSTGHMAGECRALPRDGRQLWASVRGVRLDDGTLMAFCSDITATRRAESALRESEARFRQLIETLPQLVWTCDADGNCDYASPQCLAYTGAGADSHYGRGWRDFVHPDDRETMYAAWESAHSTGEEYRGEFRMRRYDGTHRWFDGRAVPMRDDSGRVVKWLGLASDIEEARELRETLRREKERFVQLASAAPGVVHTFALSADGTPAFRYLSPRVSEIYGVDAETMTRDAMVGLRHIHRDDAPRLWASVDDSARTMTPWREEFRVLHPDKGEIWVEGHSAPLREADGTVVWHGILHDITQRKRMEEALRTSRSQLIAALDAGGMGVWTWDVANDRFTWDESGLRVLGIDRDDAARATFASLVELMHSADRPRVRASIDALLREGAHASGEYRIAQADGSTRWIEYTARAERDAAGRPVRVIGINVDITNRKRAEESQLRSQKLEALGTLAGGIAHDFNNILVAITGNTKLAKADLPLGHPAQESLDEIARAGARAVDLVRRILTFSRPYDHKRDVMALVPVVDEALKLVRATLPAMIEIRTRYDRDAPPVLIDPTQVHQIIVNLATNAAHAIGAHGGHIDVRIDAVGVGPDFASHAAGLREGRYVRLEVADDGCGMDRETLERIFDPFFTTKPQGLGTGLGLSVVHGIVKSYDGAVTVYSELGKGTAFRIYFPAAHGPPAQPRATPSESALARGAHVLFVDDEPPLVVLVSRMLERLGYRVSATSDAEKALALFRREPQSFDAVVTDLAMAGMSGFDVARDVLSLRPDLPVVMMSGFIRPEDQQTAAGLGVRAIILKPDTVEELGYVLNRVLRAPPDETQEPADRVADPLA